MWHKSGCTKEKMKRGSCILLSFFLHSAGFFKLIHLNFFFKKVCISHLLQTFTRCVKSVLFSISRFWTDAALKWGPRVEYVWAHFAADLAASGEGLLRVRARVHAYSRLCGNLIGDDSNEVAILRRGALNCVDRSINSWIINADFKNKAIDCSGNYVPYFAKAGLKLHHLFCLLA